MLGVEGVDVTQPLSFTDLGGDSLGATAFVFVHISAVEKAGYTTLAEGARVSYELVDRSGKSFAENLRVG